MYNDGSLRRTHRLRHTYAVAVRSVSLPLPTRRTDRRRRDGGGMEGMGGMGGMGGMYGGGMYGGGMYGNGMYGGGMYGMNQGQGGPMVFLQNMQMFVYQFCEIAQMVECNA